MFGTYKGPTSMLRILTLTVIFVFSVSGPSICGQESQENEATFSDREALDQFDAAMIFELGIQSAEIEAMMFPMMEEMLAPGPVVEGWSTKGLDFTALVASFAEKNGSAFYFEPSEMGLFVGYQGEPRTLLDDGYTRHRIMDGTATGMTETGLFQLFPDIWMEFITGTEVIDNAQCSAGIAQVDLLTKRPLSQWSDEELGMVTMFYAMFTDLADADVCIVYERGEDGNLRGTSYNRKGNLIPKLNADQDVIRLATQAEILERIGSEE